MANYILVMDQGTTGSRGVIYDEKGKTVAIDYEEYEQFFPNSGWWEQSGKTVWEVTLRTSRNAIKKAGLTGKDIAAIGIANQRETTTIWDKATGEPIYNTIVWGCRRTADICAKLIEEGYNDTVNKKTGLVIDPTYSGSKIRWILDEVEGAQERAEKGELLFGTIDCWLLYNLTKGKVHATDYSNAARSMVMNAHELKWDDELLSMLNIPKCMLPEIKPSVGIFGYTDPEWFGAEIPITGIAGDQSAALFGQACFEEGAAKNTYGTSAVPLMYTGDVAPETEKGLLTVAWGKDGKVKYFGVSNQNPYQIELLQKYVGQKLIANQLQFGIMHTGMIDAGINVNMTNDVSVVRDGGVLEYCRLKDITIQAWSPYQYGFFDGVFLDNEKFPELNKVINKIAEKKGVSNVTIATAWILRHPAKMQVVVGTMNEGRLRDIAKASNVALTREEWYEIYIASGHILP